MENAIQLGADGSGSSGMRIFDSGSHSTGVRMYWLVLVAQSFVNRPALNL